MALAVAARRSDATLPTKALLDAALRTAAGCGAVLLVAACGGSDEPLTPPDQPAAVAQDRKDPKDKIEDVFAKIIWNVPPAFYAYDSFVANDAIFHNPINLLSEFRVKFTRQDGQPYEFNSIEHSFTVEVWSIVQT